MSFSRGPNTVTDGLVMCFDTLNPRSYTTGATSWIDLKGSSLTIPLSGKVTNTTESFKFNGVDDEILVTWPASLNSDDNTTPRTWECLVQPSGSITQSEILGHRGTANTSYSANGGFYIYGGTYRFLWYDNASYQYLDSTVTPIAGETVHLVATFDTDRKPRIYVDGELKATYGTATNMIYGAGMVVFLMGYNERDGGKEYFSGYIPLFRYYKGNALSSSDVKQNYEAFKTRINKL